MATHVTKTTMYPESNGGTSDGVTLSDLTKTHVFTSSLPPDPAFPSPIDSHKAPRRDLGPRIVKGALYTYIRPEKSEDPELLSVSKAALRDFGLKEDEVRTDEFKELVAGNQLLDWNEEKGEGLYPWAQCYGGTYYISGGSLDLGQDSLVMVEQSLSSKQHIHLPRQDMSFNSKEPGKPLILALNALHIPTTRALSLTLLPHCKVRRERSEPGAIVARFAQSWLRIGTFDILRARGDRDLIRQLSTYIAENVFSGWRSLPATLALGDVHETALNPERDIAAEGIQGGEGQEENRFARLYREIVRRNAKTVAAWQAYAFTNGVLNTDNTSLFGLSIDFGPFAFLDDFDPNYTPNHDDHLRRYSYSNQPSIIWWNLLRLGESMGELIGAGDKVDDQTVVEKGVTKNFAPEIIKRAEIIIGRTGEEYKAVFLAEYKRLMTARLGLRSQKQEDFEKLFSELLDTLAALELDFNQFFRKLSSVRLQDVETDEHRRSVAGRFFHHEGVTGLGVTDESARARVAEWLERWRIRVTEDWGEKTDDKREAFMKKVNPKFIPKSWILDELIERVERGGEREILHHVMHMALNPFEDSWGWDEKDEERFCGDVPRSARAMQCSCSS